MRRRLFLNASRTVVLGAALVALLVIVGDQAGIYAQSESSDPPEIILGERLFLETRFAQFFAQLLAKGGRVNDPLPSGDPVMESTATTSGPLPGPFAGLSMNCRACHLVDEQADAPGGTMRTYADFARRSPVPAREDGVTSSPRNSPALVNATLPRQGGLLLHFDAEFSTTTDLVKGTLTGRNFGWLPGERAQAVAHIARIIREDDGSGPVASDFGNLPYSIVLTGTDPAIPGQFRIPESFRIPVSAATDTELFNAVAKLVAAYTENLTFSQDEAGAFNLSPYDVFLEKNRLPRKPGSGESMIDYSRRLLTLIEGLERSGRLSWVAQNPHSKHRRHARHVRFVTKNPATADGAFRFHHHPFRFGADELRGLKIFFAESGRNSLVGTDRGGVGNCIACHHAPTFTDFRLHNTGVTQAEYDRIHGAGSFAKLHIPDLSERNAHHDHYLPATEQHPLARGPFRAIPTPGDPGLTDLGVWNIFANPDFPSSQQRIRRLLCLDLLPAGLPGSNVQTQLGNEAMDRLMNNAPLSGQCSQQTLLRRSIALFKTPGLRDLGHSAPYMHNGQLDTLEEIVNFYRQSSDLQRSGRLRNGDPELAGIRLNERDVRPLTAFLLALDEDYE